MVKSISDFNFTNKRVLLRVDFNVPFADDGSISDATRIDASLPTIDKIMKDGGIPIIMSHLGRPKGEKNLKYSLAPIAKYLMEKLHYKVKFAPDCIGDDTISLTKSAVSGEIVLLENVRFYAQEEKNDAEFSATLAKNGDVYVNDAFGSAHRSHSSVDGVARLFNDRFAGLLMIKEVQYLGSALESPKKPFVSIIGGAKISGKIDVINNLLDKCDTIIIGGGMAYTFYKAMGLNIGNSLLEEDKIDVAKSIIDAAKSKGANLLLPTDTKIADKFDNNAATKFVKNTEIPDGWMGMDIGNDTIAKYCDVIESAKTVVWNGPMGVFEMPNFEAGTKAVALSLTKATANGAITIIGGGDSAAAINQFGYADKVSHVSTGGGASLEFLEGKKLPGVEALNV
ncbi:MAG: phosphoglycerate kinase [Ignavibacteria bacterium]|jgi:phosphoglycerate kinase|nr:phosphoglycerate kinase [Ignavibacteria bacterium]